MRGQTAAGAFSAKAVALTDGVMRSMFLLKKMLSAGAVLLAAVFVPWDEAPGAYSSMGWQNRRKPAAEPGASTPKETFVKDTDTPTDASLPVGGPWRVSASRSSKKPTLLQVWPSSRDGQRLGLGDPRKRRTSPNVTVTVHVWESDEPEGNPAAVSSSEDSAGATTHGGLRSGRQEL